MTEHDLREARDIAAAAGRLDRRLKAIEKALSARTRIILVGLALVALVGVYMVGSQMQAQSDRRLMLTALQEIKDCTTPTADNACQRRLAEGQKPVLAYLSNDNLNASIAVGTCLSERATDVKGCARERFRALTEEASKAQTPTTTIDR